MRQSYLKNAALLTGADVVLRLAGLGLRIWLANALGGEGMGLYQLVLAVYSLFVTLATAGVSVAATRLMAEELSTPEHSGSARGMLRRLLAAGLALGFAANRPSSIVRSSQPQPPKNSPSSAPGTRLCRQFCFQARR